MDFLNIRKKAQERARARAAAEADARAREAEQAPEAPSPSAAPPAAPPGPPARRRRRPGKRTPPPDAPVVTEEDVLEGALAARLQGLSAPEDPAAAAPAPDPRFTTWRPGSGEPPVVPPEPEPSGEVLARAEDFAVVGPWTPGLVAAPLSPPSPWTMQPAPEPEPAPADPLDEFFYREDEAGPALPELASAEPEPEAAPAPLAREEFLTFLLGSDEYAVDIERVREVVRPPPIAEVPRAPPHILGVVTVRGEVVAVLDPRRRLGLAPAQPAEGEGKIVIVDAGEGPVGLQVDRVASVVRLRAGSIEPCPQGIAGSRGEFLAGIGRDGDRLFTVLDLTTLLRRPPARGEPGRSVDA